MALAISTPVTLSILVLIKGILRVRFLDIFVVRSTSERELISEYCGTSSTSSYDNAKGNSGDTIIIISKSKKLRKI
jgi:hypothetical protein